MSFTQLELSYIVPIYIENVACNVLNQLISRYENYSSELINKIQFVFIDDCSPIKIDIPENCKLHYTFARVEDNITWNQGGARNLGVHLSRASKLILTDLDHIFPENILFNLLSFKEPKYLYKFKREKDGKRTTTAPNIFFCTKGTFFKVLGVDEEFCGNYGYEDIFFTEMQKAVGTKIKEFGKKNIIVNEHKDTEYKHHNLIRDTTINEALLQKKLSILKTGKIFTAHSRIFLNFTWKLLQEKFN